MTNKQPNKSLVTTDSDIKNIIALGERDEYVIQDKLKSKGLFSPLDRIKNIVKQYNEDESEKFAMSNDTYKHFKWLSKKAAPDMVSQMHAFTLLKEAYYRNLRESYIKSYDKAKALKTNPEAKKKAAEAAIKEFLKN